MNHIPHIPLPGDTLTRAEKRRETLDDLYATLEGMIKALRYLANEADRTNKAMDIPGVESGLEAIEAAADHFKTGLDWLDVQP